MNPHKHTRTTLSICCISMFNHFSFIHNALGFEKPLNMLTHTLTHQTYQIYRLKRYRIGKDRDESDGIYLIRFMEASYVVRFATYRSVGRLVDRGLNSVPELLLISMPLCQKKNNNTTISIEAMLNALWLNFQYEYTLKHTTKEILREKKENGLAFILYTCNEIKEADLRCNSLVWFVGWSALLSWCIYILFFILIHRSLISEQTEQKVRIRPTQNYSRVFLLRKHIEKWMDLVNSIEIQENKINRKKRILQQKPGRKRRKRAKQVNEDSSFVYSQSLIATFNALFESVQTKQRCCQVNIHSHILTYRDREREKGQ